jgi:hypothetical protein
MHCYTGLLWLAGSLAMAADVQPQLLGGICSPYGGYVQSSGTGNGMVQQLVLRVSGTGIYLDDLEIKISTVEVRQRMMNPFSYVRCPRVFYHDIS